MCLLISVPWLGRSAIAMFPGHIHLILGYEPFTVFHHISYFFIVSL